MIVKGSSGVAAEVVFTVTNSAGPVTARTWAAGELKVAAPGGTFVNATVANIVSRGLGVWTLQLTATETAGVGVVAVKLSIAGIAESDGYQAFTAEVADVGTGAIAAAVWTYVIEGTSTAQAYMKRLAATVFGKLIIAGTTRRFRDPDDTVDRVTATADATGRPVVTYV